MKLSEIQLIVNSDIVNKYLFSNFDYNSILLDKCNILTRNICIYNIFVPLETIKIDEYIFLDFV